MISYTNIKACRLCGSTNLEQVLHLGHQYVVNFIPSDELPAWQRGEREQPLPLTVLMCMACKFVQLRESVDPDRLYRKFWYLSGTNESMRQTLREIVQEASAKVNLPPDGAVLDIGCNDGTLLSFYRSGITKVGYDPAENLADRAKVTARTPLIYADYFPPKGWVQGPPPEPWHRYDIITAIAMFYDLEDPRRFLQAIKDCLRPGGVFVVQMNYLLSMLQNNAVDNIAHEHLCYYSLNVMCKLVESCGLIVKDATTNGVNGGSLRVYISHPDLPRTDQEVKNILSLLHAEDRAQLDDPATYVAFSKVITQHVHSLTSYVERRLQEHANIYLYGASTRGSTLMQLTPLNYTHIKAAAERNPEKYGLHMAGTWIPIISEADARRYADIFLVLPWHFRQAILEREHNTLLNGAEFVFPLPQPAVYSAKYL